MATNPTKREDIGSFIQSITALHGTAQFTHKKGRSLMLWSVAVLGNMVLTVIFILVIRGRYNNNQVVTRINANCKVSQVPFPAVSICNFNMVSLQETSIIKKILNQYNRSEEEIQSFFQSLQHLKDFDIVARKNQNFTEIVALLKEHYFTIENIMEEVHQKCDKLLLLCTFNGKVKNCNNFFSLIKTYEGYCCTFNYAALNDNTDSQWSKDEDIEYYEDPSAGDVKSNGGIIITSQSGRGSGLSVVLNVDPEDYPVWTRLPFYGAKVLISDPNDYPETTVLYKYVSIGESLDIKVEPRLFQCENDVRRVEPLKRSCWFHDEVVLEHTDRYSYETCKTECRMQNFLKYCGCIPYKYPAEASKRTCEFKDLPCLSKYRAYVKEDQKSCDPICLPECRDKKYSITSDSMPLLRQGLPPEVIVGRNVSDLAALQVYFAKSTSNCYKLTLLMDFNYFIATYGGIFSLSFGASVLTLFEIAFLLLRAALNILNQQAQKIAVKLQKTRAKKIKAQSIDTKRKWDNTRY